MAATPLAATTRYIRPGKTEVVIAPAVESTSGAATREEINAGLAVQGEIQSVTGFTQSATKIDTPDWGSRETTSIPGLVSIADSSITFYASDDGADIREELEMDDDCVVIFMDNGDVAADPMDVFKCSVASVATSRDGQNAQTVTVSFTVRKVFERVAIPAVT